MKAVNNDIALFENRDIFFEINLLKPASHCAKQLFHGVFASSQSEDLFCCSRNLFFPNLQSNAVFRGVLAVLKLKLSLKH